MNPADRVDQRMRAADPAAAIDRDPHGNSARQLLQQARNNGGAPPAALGRPPRKRMVVAIAAIFTVLGSVAAVAAGVFSPDPADVSAILDDATKAAEVHGEGWRPVLNAEAVLCVYANGHSTSTFASEFPLDQPLTQNALEKECTTGNDIVRSGLAAAPTDMTICQARATTAELETRIAERGERIVRGRIDGDRPGSPVVLGWDGDCASTQLSQRPHAHLSALTSLDTLNRVREVEVGLRAASLDRCLTEESALDMAEHARQRLPGQWPILKPQTGVGGPCHTVQLDAEWGALLLL